MRRKIIIIEWLFFTQQSLNTTDFRTFRNKGRARLTIEDAFDVDGKNVVPALLLRKVVVRRAPAYARVVDQNVQFRLAFLELSDERITPCFRLCTQRMRSLKKFRQYETHSNVGHNIVCLPAAQFVEVLDSLEAGPSIAMKPHLFCMVHTSFSCDSFRAAM
jgi:hypothetical protein